MCATTLASLVRHMQGGVRGHFVTMLAGAAQDG
jgi:hypothetical protein